MKHYNLQANESVLYQGEVSIEKRNGNVELILTNLNLVCIISTKKLFSKEQVEVEVYPVGDIKIYNDTPQIKQKGSRVEIFLSSNEIPVVFSSLFEAGKFVKSAFHLLTGKTTAGRGADKVKGAVGLVDNALGIKTADVVKNTIENGLAGTILGGIGKKSVPSVSKNSLAKDAVDVAKELLVNGKEENTVSVPNDEQIETLKKMKELVDIGVLTQEEFDAKKKQLLGL